MVLSNVHCREKPLTTTQCTLYTLAEKSLKNRTRMAIVGLYALATTRDGKEPEPSKNETNQNPSFAN